jgi:hypothetical protein
MQKLRGSNFNLDDGTLYNKQTISENVTIPTNINAMWVGTITIDTGKTVTIPTGSRLVIV